MNLLSWLFPAACLCCGDEGEQLCAKCCGHIPPLADEPPAPAGLTRVVCATLYQPPISEAIQTLKYSSAKSLGQTLGNVMFELTKDCDWPGSPLLVPVPIHTRRKRERGFNQAELLAQTICQRTGWGVRTDLLLRTRYTPPQAKLDKNARQTNLTGAFQLAHEEEIRDRHVILVDDVLTTGATLTACAEELQTAKPASVSGLCLAYDAPPS